MELLALLVVVVIIPLNSVLNGWVLTKLWAWFMVPTFGLPELGIVPAIGLSMIIGYLTQHATSSKSSDEDKYKSSGQRIAEAIGKAIFVPLFYLFIGWIVSLFM